MIKYFNKTTSTSRCPWEIRNRKYGILIPSMGSHENGNSLKNLMRMGMSFTGGNPANCYMTGQRHDIPFMYKSVIRAHLWTVKIAIVRPCKKSGCTCRIQRIQVSVAVSLYSVTLCRPIQKHCVVRVGTIYGPLHIACIINVFIVLLYL